MDPAEFRTGLDRWLDEHDGEPRPDHAGAGRLDQQVTQMAKVKRLPFHAGSSSAQWRSEFLYSRAASNYGGSAEIQRNITARRLVDLGNDR